MACFIDFHGKLGTIPEFRALVNDWRLRYGIHTVAGRLATCGPECASEHRPPVGARFSVFQTTAEGIRLVQAKDFRPAAWTNVDLKELYCPNETAIQFFENAYKHVLLWGNRGGAKSTALVWKAIFKAWLVPGSRSILFRRVIPELKKTLISVFQKLPEELRGRYNDNDKVSRLGPVTGGNNSSEIWFASADTEADVRKALSGEYDLMLFDEWAEWPYSMWDFATGSSRSTQARDIFGFPTGAQIGGATNPMGTGGTALQYVFGCDHKKQCVPGGDASTYNPALYCEIRSDIADNPAYAIGTKAGDEYRSVLATKSKRIQAAWVYGRWDGFEGQYFESLDEVATKISHDDFLRLLRKQYWAPRWMSLDWGKVHHAYASWHALLEIGGRNIPVTYDELLVKGLGEAALAEELCDRIELNGDKEKIVKFYLSPETFGEDSTSIARRIGNVCASRGVPRPVPAKNSRHGPKAATNGWRHLEDLITVRHQAGDLSVWMPTEKGGYWRPAEPGEKREISGWLISDNCAHAWESLPQAECDPKSDGDVKKEGDAPHLDVNDGLRYGIASHISPEERPFDDKLKEELSKIPIEGPNRYIKHLNMLKEEREKDSGVFYVGARPGGRIGRRRR